MVYTRSPHPWDNPSPEEMAYVRAEQQNLQNLRFNDVRSTPGWVKTLGAFFQQALDICIGSNTKPSGHSIIQKRIP